MFPAKNYILKFNLLSVHALLANSVLVGLPVLRVYKGSQAARLVIRAIVRVRLELGLEH